MHLAIAPAVRWSFAGCRSAEKRTCKQRGRHFYNLQTRFPFGACAR